jgi:uncharacterized membrane protein YhaH (DUF805 family)
MDFQEAVRVCFAKYVDFEGEASRSEFWWFFLFTGVVSFALALVSNKLSGLFSLAVLVPLIAVTVRRLHDTNRSGWWMLICFLPVVGWLILAFLLVQEGDPPQSLPRAAD